MDYSISESRLKELVFNYLSDMEHKIIKHNLIGKSSRNLYKGNNSIFNGVMEYIDWQKIGKPELFYLYFKESDNDESDGSFIYHKQNYYKQANNKFNDILKEQFPINSFTLMDMLDEYLKEKSRIIPEGYSLILRPKQND